MAPPFIILPACHREFVGRIFHAVIEEYVEATRLAGCQPLLVPCVAEGELEALLDLAASVLLPGSPSNVHPSHFGEEVLDAAQPLDPQRDALTLPLIRSAMTRGIPLLGICRGFQEMNVALRGSLHQAIHRVSGYGVHSFREEEPLERIYGPSHEVCLRPGGLLERLLGATCVTVNSRHGQGIHMVAPGLVVEARASDGMVEAITLPTAPGFNLGVQWHPEWHAAGNPVSMAIFRAFGAACRAFHAQRIDATANAQ